MVVRKVDGKFRKIPSLNPVPNVDEDIRLIMGTCMICGGRATYAIAEEAWEEGYHTADDLCGCGLTTEHKGLHLQEIIRRVAS